MDSEPTVEDLMALTEDEAVSYAQRMVDYQIAVDDVPWDTFYPEDRRKVLAYAMYILDKRHKIQEEKAKAQRRAMGLLLSLIHI